MDLFDAATIAAYTFGLMGNHNTRAYMEAFFDAYHHADIDHMLQQIHAWQTEYELMQILKTPLPDIPAPYIER